MKKRIFTVLIIIVAIAAIVLLGLHLINRNKVTEKNPYELNLDSIRKTDSSKLCYREVMNINLDMERPSGIACGKNDQIFVSGENYIYVFNRDGKLLKKINTKVFGRSIAVSEDDKIFLGAEDHVEIYDTNGHCTEKWKSITGSSVITSIAVKNKTVYIADAQENRVFLYNLKGKKLRTIGSNDTNETVTRFIIPSYYFDLAVDPKGSLWVVNPGQHLLVNFDKKGNVLSYWGKASAAVDCFCGCCNPGNIAVLSDGSFITSEKAIVRVKKYNAKGVFQCVLAGPEHFAEGSKGLDIAVDSKQRIYVLEPKIKLIHVFEEK